MKKSKKIEDLQAVKKVESNCNENGGICLHGTRPDAVWFGCSYRELLRVIEHGSIPCIEVLIAGATHVAPTKFGRPSDVDLSGW